MIMEGFAMKCSKVEDENPEPHYPKSGPLTSQQLRLAQLITSLIN